MKQGGDVLISETVRDKNHTITIITYQTTKKGDKKKKIHRDSKKITVSVFVFCVTPHIVISPFLGQ